jgi:hypothetical protein
VGNAERVGDAVRVMDILAGATAALAPRCCAMSQLQGNADDVVAGLLHEGRDDGRIDPTRHCNDDALALTRLGVRRGRS